MKTLLARFLDIPRPVLAVLLANLLLNLVNGALMLIFNIYLRELGHEDDSIAELTSYRFLGVLLLALPCGILLRGRRLKPFFLAAAVILPVSSWLMVNAAAEGADGWLITTTLAWGVGMMIMQVSVLPFIIRETTEENRTEAISLSFAAWATSMLACGVLIPGLEWIGSIQLGSWVWHFDEAGVLHTMVILSMAALPLLLWAPEKPPPDEPRLRLWNARREYDWGLIAKASAPNLVIAVGAGLTIPFINLFFNGVFHLESHEFSVLGGAAGLPVLAGFLLNPYVKRRFGYGVAIVLSQSLSVLFLVLMALTELFQEVPGMFWVAAGCFLLRQPLMNMAAPITSDLAISYVGSRNRELISALGASIWSGSWFISAKVFEFLRKQDLYYWQIFLITAGLYIVATFLYSLLIRDHRRRSSAAVGSNEVPGQEGV